MANKKKTQITEKSMVNDGNKLYEQVNHPDEGIVFVHEKKPDKFIYVDSVDTDNGVIYPIKDEEQMRAVLLPNYPLNYESEDQLIADLCDHIRKYVDVSEDFVVFSAYYAMMSWVHDKINTLPYMRVMGDTGCGKSRYLDVVGRLCYKPMMMAGAITPAPIYRMIGRWGGTAIIDEGDFKDSDEKNEVVKILNCGFERGRPVLRCSQDNVDNILVLETFGPKIISTRYSFKDKALESRCLTEIMKKSRNKPILLPNKFYEEEQVLRNKLLMFRFKWRNKIDTNKIEEVDLGDIDPRIKQATASFTVLFSNIVVVMEQFREFLSRYNEKLIDERAESYDGMLVNAFFELLVSGGGMFGSGDVAKKYKEMYGYDTTSRTVGKHLKSLGFDVTQKKIDGKNRRILDCDVTLLGNLLNQYVSPKSDLFSEVKKVTSVTSVTSTLGELEKNKKNRGSPLSPYTNVTDVTNVTRSVREKLAEWKKSGDHKDAKTTQFLNNIFDFTEEEIEKLNKEGIIFSPEPGKYRLV